MKGGLQLQGRSPYSSHLSGSSRIVSGNCHESYMLLDIYLESTSLMLDCLLVRRLDQRVRLGAPSESDHM